LAYSPFILINVWPSSSTGEGNWSPINFEIKLSDLGSKLHPTKVSRIILLLVLSSPLLIDKLNVPLAVLTPLISYLKLSLEPETSDPSLYCSPSSVALMELLSIVPSPIVFKVNALVPVPSVPPDNVNTSVLIEPPEPVSIVIELPAVPADEAEIPKNVVPSKTVIPAPKLFAVPILATNLSIAVAADEPVPTKKIGELSAGNSSGSEAINLNSVLPTVTCNSSPSSSKKLFVNVNSPVAKPAVAPWLAFILLLVAESQASPEPETTLVTNKLLPPFEKYFWAAIEVKYSIFVEAETKVVPNLFL